MWRGGGVVEARKKSGVSGWEGEMCGEGGVVVVETRYHCKECNVSEDGRGECGKERGRGCSN